MHENGFGVTLIRVHPLKIFDDVKKAQWRVFNTLHIVCAEGPRIKRFVAQDKKDQTEDLMRS